MKKLWYILAACMTFVILSQSAHAGDTEIDAEPNPEKICEKASEEDRPDCLEALDSAHKILSPVEWVLLVDCLSEHDALDEEKFKACFDASEQDETEEVEEVEEVEDPDLLAICETAAEEDQDECAAASAMLQEALTPEQWRALVDCASEQDVMTEARFEACVKKAAPGFMDNPPIEGEAGTLETPPGVEPPTSP